MLPMDPSSLLPGLGIGAATGALLAALVFRGRSAALHSQLDVLRLELAKADSERETLRARSTELTASEAGARAAALAHETRVGQLQSEVGTERERAETAIRLHSEVQTQLGRLETQLEEREKALLELQRMVELSKEQLTQTFKAAGADVLKSTAESLLQQAREQFEGHSKLSRLELEARQNAVEALVAPLKEQLVKQEKLVLALGEKREGDSKALAEQLKQIADLQLQASQAAHSLSSAMRDTRQRGQWGEVSLRNVVELAGLAAHVDFVEQSSIPGPEGRLRPDMVVRLPGGRSVPIDAKAPMNAYLDSLDTQTPESDRATRRAAHATTLRNHVRTLGSRAYAANLGGGTELTVMFVPVESALVAALEFDGTLFKDALDQGIVITTPSTLLALLRVCALQWQQASVNENARRIGQNAKELLERVRKFAEHFQKVGLSLDQAGKAFSAAVGSYNSRLVPVVRDTAALAASAGDTPPAELEAVRESVRLDIAAPDPLPASEPQ
jgi:DNA recombination protein RmuC